MTAERPGFILTLSAAGAVGAATAAFFLLRRALNGVKKQPINSLIKMEEKKVTDVVDIEELYSKLKPGDKVSYCRCWKSKDWPYCDGAHKEHNSCNDDNVGALNIVRKKIPTS